MTEKENGGVMGHDGIEKICRIADTYGYDAQSRQCIEEMAELTQAINKLWRKPGKDSMKHVVEEIADVQIMLCQMVYLLGDDGEEIANMIDTKLDRQIKRIEGNE